MSIFEQASRKKLRFAVTGIGNISTEDLWDLSLGKLDEIYAGLAEHAQKQNVTRLMDTNRVDDGVSLRMSLIEHVFNTKKAEWEAHKLRVQARQEFNRLLDIKARKQVASLEALSEEELDAKIAELQEALE
jgi:hypothetical protein